MISEKVILKPHFLQKFYIVSQNYQRVTAKCIIISIF
jgi:hypothetical protein